MPSLVTEYQSSMDCVDLLLKSFYEHFAAFIVIVLYAS